MDNRINRCFLSADLHLGHTKIIDLCRRPFADVEEMNERLIENWNNRIGPKDTALILGDLFIHPHCKKREERHAQIDKLIALCARLNGHKYLLRGNHDPVHPGDNPVRSAHWDAEFQRVAGITVLSGDHRLLTERILISHYPWAGTFDDRHSERHPRPEDYPSVEILLHGHVHGMATDRDHGWKFNGNMINVGVDVWDYAPVELAQALEEYNIYRGQL